MTLAQQHKRAPGIAERRLLELLSQSHALRVCSQSRKPPQAHTLHNTYRAMSMAQSLRMQPAVARHFLSLIPPAQPKTGNSKKLLIPAIAARIQHHPNHRRTNRRSNRKQQVATRSNQPSAVNRRTERMRNA